MAIPTNPTKSTIVAEGLKKAGQTNPSAALTARAEDYWMEEIKNDIYLNAGKVQKKLKSLFVTSILVATVGVHRYSLPSDYAGDLTVTILDGDTTGTLQDGAAASATLAASETSTEADLLGKYILITSGTGISSCSQVTAYNTTTKVASVSPNFNTTPVTGDGYRIITEFNYLDPTNILQMDLISSLTISGKPTSYAAIGDAEYGEIVFDLVPDLTYGIQLRYYVDLSLTDLSATRIVTVYRKWRNVWVQGIYAKAFEELHDVRAKDELKKYYLYIETMLMDETSGQDANAMCIQIER